jgi:enoyl-CoA hydratase/carnithine racemase
MPTHFLWEFQNGVATITLNRPERKNPLTFHSYDELRDTFRALDKCWDVKAVVIRGAGGNFSSGGDVHEIIGPLTKMDRDGLLAFTRMTGDLVRAMRACPQPIIAAVEGVCAGAGAIMAMASDIRFGQPGCTTAFLFSRVGLSGADMGACAILPRILGHGRAAELLFTGRNMTSDEGLAWGFYNRVVEDVMAEAYALADQLAKGPSIAQAVTKKQLDAEWNMSIEDALEAEAQAQARCMETQDFKRAYEAFAAKKTPEFKGD